MGSGHCSFYTPQTPAVLIVRLRSSGFFLAGHHSLTFCCVMLCFVWRQNLILLEMNWHLPYIKKVLDFTSEEASLSLCWNYGISRHVEPSHPWLPLQSDHMSFSGHLGFLQQKLSQADESSLILHVHFLILHTPTDSQPQSLTINL